MTIFDAYYHMSSYVNNLQYCLLKFYFFVYFYDLSFKLCSRTQNYLHYIYLSFVHSLIICHPSHIFMLRIFIAVH